MTDDRSQTSVPMAGTPGDVSEIDSLSINTIRTLSMDAVQAANSGHPGTPMALAPVAYTLWQDHLRFDPADPLWPNRDRFVLSNGHASMLLYSLLFLSEVEAVNTKYETTGRPSITLDDIRSFRQFGSRCPGHPEYRWTSGVETTTGPLGQGISTSVGMAASARWMGTHFNRDGFEMFDFDVYAICGDGCLMEGISSESASLAGHLKLSNLCWIYDNNHITIEGHTELAFTDDVATRFLGYGWNVTRVADANDLDSLNRAMEVFKSTDDRPTLIIVDSDIGWGAPHKQGTSAAHGEALGVEEIALTKKFYNWPSEEPFFVPNGVKERFREKIGTRGAGLRAQWLELYERYAAEHPELAGQLHAMQHRELPENWDSGLKEFPADEKGMASRVSSGKVLNAVAEHVPWMVGGAADLSPSTKTRLEFDGAGDFQSPAWDGSYGGNNMHFGIREHGMAAFCNGMSTCKIRPFGSTFFIFSDYARGSIRLSALMELPVIYIFTHDSIGLGEDGPTHQPIEQLASLRAMPGLLAMRPCDANEVLECWRVVMPMRHEPVAFALSRQNLPTLDRTRYAPASGCANGAYVIADCDGTPEVILMGTGSEVHLCLEAHERLIADGIASRVVSMPCWELFERQSPEYRESVLPDGVDARVAVEQASTFGWERYTGRDGAVVGMTTFGASAPIAALQEDFGFEPEHVVASAMAQIERVRGQ